jgi:DNA-binding CsgD family transcriptional regulator/PAS domain-containing protein
MGENRLHSGLVGAIYDATLDPSLWSEVLEQAANFVGGPTASIFWRDATRQTGRLVHSFGLDPDHTRRYFEDYAKVDPANRIPSFDDPVAIGDLIPYEHYVATPFYREWAAPQGIVDFVSCIVDRQASEAAFFGVQRHERDGVVEGETRARMRQIAPHVRRAMSIVRAVDLGQAESSAFSDILDGLSTAIFLLAPGGRIVHANVAGRAILAADDFLYAIRGRLVARDPAIDKQLKTVFAVETGDAADEANAIALPLISKQGERYVGHVLPFTGGTGSRAELPTHRRGALFVHKATVDTATLPESIGRHFGLTSTELRVLLAIVEVGGAPEVAEALGIAVGTVKTHLHRLYQKTGTARQADLVKLVAGFASPLLS